MSFCLLTTPWIPVRRRSGRCDTIAPAGISGAGGDLAIALDWARPDFRLACLEFLIGLLTTACPPDEPRDWIEAYQSPPGADRLEAAFAPLTSAFLLDGEGPRFMQELEDFAADENPAASLLIEAPGENALKRNTDLLVKRGQVRTLSRAAAAMALYTLQTYAPAGGAGNRTSLRGGGPLTTLAIPPTPKEQAHPTLWHTLWANVPCGTPPKNEDLPRVFPWLAPTRVSDKNGRATTPADVHPLQVWWGMPRRIRLDFEANESRATCDITGVMDETVVRTWRQRPWGTNYTTWGGNHPLSPCYRVKPGTEWLYVHPQPGGIGYRHWLGLLSRDPGPTRKVAPTIEDFRDRVRDVHPGPEPWRLLAAGYDMDNMKARGFVESEMPVLEPRDPHAAQAYDALLHDLVTAADIVAGLLGRCVRRALYGENAAFDAAPLATLRERFWSDTADAFFRAAEYATAGAAQMRIRENWRTTLATAARRLFDEAAPIDGSGEGHPGRIAAAAKQLHFATAGYGKDGETLFGALGLPLPEAARKQKARRKESAR